MANVEKEQEIKSEAPERKELMEELANNGLTKGQIAWEVGCYFGDKEIELPPEYETDLAENTPIITTTSIAVGVRYERQEYLVKAVRYGWCSVQLLLNNGWWAFNVPADIQKRVVDALVKQAPYYSWVAELSQYKPGWPKKQKA